jgi:hypothetical protein
MRCLSLGLVVAVCGCGDHSVQIGVRVERSKSTSCTTTYQSAVLPMNAYMVELFLDKREDADRARGCLDCFASQRCALQQRTCVCGPSRKTSSEDLETALAGLRLGPLDDGAYCLRVIAIERTMQPAPQTDGSCSCDGDWSNSSPNPGEAPGRLCAFSTASRVLNEKTDIELDLLCGDDVDAQAVQNPLNSCTGNPMLFPLF